MSKTVKLTCPHCTAALTVDVDAGVVLHHDPPKNATRKIDMDQRLEEIKADQQRAADRMDEALRQERDRDRLMADKFKELMKGAAEKDDGKAPIRPIDLD